MSAEIVRLQPHPTPTGRCVYVFLWPVLKLAYVGKALDGWVARFKDYEKHFADIRAGKIKGHRTVHWVWMVFGEPEVLLHAADVGDDLTVTHIEVGAYQHYVAEGWTMVNDRKPG